MAGPGLSIRVQRAPTPGPPPAHHLPSAPGTSTTPAGFRNPWPSWQKPSWRDSLRSLEWGQGDDDPCVRLAASHLDDASAGPTPARLPAFADLAGWPSSTGAQAARLLRLQDPDFAYARGARATWLGHAGCLVQLPPLAPGGAPFRCLFDPIFAARASPTQLAGPVRAYPPPCDLDALPPVDLVLISHNHFDHMEWETLESVWRQGGGGRTRFLVPLGNKQWFVDGGIPEERVEELDWWDEAVLGPEGEGKGKGVKVVCTPAQHNSGRTLYDANATLWCSWYIEHPGGGEDDAPMRVYFAGDTGFQFHASPSWPPAPPAVPLPTTDPPPQRVREEDEDNEHPQCPAFAEIRRRLGPPDLLFLPVSVGATYAYLRSLVPLVSYRTNPFPRHSPGVAAANHLPPWDAVRVMGLLAGGEGREEKKKGRGRGPVAVAMHWGTFVTDPVEVLRTLGELEWACVAHGVRFARDLSAEEGGRDGPVFLALNHGQSVDV
jgi:N-acyl-phosphatidylethanolamine-hydrolysing phospholipase D